MKKYTHLFFDLDHTLWDFDANSKATLHHLYEHFCLQQMGADAFEAFNHQFEQYNETLWARLRSGDISREELRWRRMDLTLKEYDINYEGLAKDMSTLYLATLPKQKILMDGALELLDYCKEKYPLYLITNGFEKTQWQKLETAGLGHYFQAMYTSEIANSMKPHAPIFNYALEDAKASTETSIMIGDSMEADIIGARNLGIDQIFYNPHQVAHQEIVTFEVKNLTEIMNIL